MREKSLRDLMRDKKVSPDNLTNEQKAQFEKLKDQANTRIRTCLILCVSWTA